VRLPGGPHVHGRRACRRQPGVAQLVDLYSAVIDELCGGQAGGGAEDGEADRPLRGNYGAEAGRDASRPASTAQQPSFEQSQAAEEENTGGTQTAAEATPSGLRRTPGPG